MNDLRVDMMVNILVHSLRKWPLTLVLAREPPDDMERVMEIAQKYINEEEINLLKDQQWTSAGMENKEKSLRDCHQCRSDREQDRELYFWRLPKFDKYNPLNVSRAKALMTIDSQMLQ